ncbi:MAG: cytochrome c [Gammaproteobacteria bacterium]|nr:cytochrome c [Gammaproteobacteria bacterium]
MKKRIAVFLTLVLFLTFVGSVMAGNPMRGRTVYNKHCLGCHGGNGVSPVGDMVNFSLGEGLMQPDQALELTIKNGKGIMPGYAGTLTDQQISDVIAHLRTFF